METRDINTMKLGASDPGAWASLGGRQAQNVAQSASQRFGQALQQMLQQYQQVGTAKFKGAELQGIEQQAGRISAQTPQDLIGASPQLQAGVRGAEAGAIQSNISGTQALGKTFTEQLQGFGDALAQASAIGKWMQEEETSKQEQARDLIFKFPSAVKALDEKERSALEQQAGLQKGLIDLLPVEQEEKWQQITLSDGSLGQQNTKTGEINVLVKADTSSAGAEATARSEVLMSLNNVRTLLANPELSNISGLQFPVTNEARYAKKLYEQVKSVLTVTNRAKLKGQGSISDWEGKLLEGASSALSRVLGDEQFVKELNKVKAALSAYAGLSVEVKIIDQKSGQSDQGTLTPEEVEDAIKQGYLIEYL